MVWKYSFMRINVNNVAARSVNFGFLAKNHMNLECHPPYLSCDFWEFPKLKSDFEKRPVWNRRKIQRNALEKFHSILNTVNTPTSIHVSRSGRFAGPNASKVRVNTLKGMSNLSIVHVQSNKKLFLIVFLLHLKKKLSSLFYDRCCTTTGLR